MNPLRPPTVQIAAVLASVLCGGLLAACSGESHAGFQERLDRFRATHAECPKLLFREPCQIGPDGRLYQYLPGETQD